MVYESLVAKNRGVIASLPSTRTAVLYAVSFFAVFGRIKLIRNLKYIGAVRVKFLYCPLICWN